MANRTPEFWWRKNSFAKIILAPIGYLYGYFSGRKMHTAKPAAIAVPVLCIGNFTLGGTGKTPLAIAMAQAAKSKGLIPGIVSRGYGGSLTSKKKTIHIVDILKDQAEEVGDEPLLLAQIAPVAIGANRYLAAEKLMHQGVNFIIMDDGFQSRRLLSDYALLTIDSMRGLGNGSVFPSGPLRAPLDMQLSYCDSILSIGGRSCNKETITQLEALTHKKINQASFSSFISFSQFSNHMLKINTIEDIKGRELLAFCGIGNPDKFFNSLELLGGIVKEKISFADHHYFRFEEVSRLIEQAKKNNLIIITTAKDYVRLKSRGLDKKLQNLIVMDIKLNFSITNFCFSVIETTLFSYQRRIT